jgi:putative PIN family toxin of toxin-antitoxin system
VSVPVAVIDTNVVVSGLLTGEPSAPTRRILDAMLAGRFTYLLSIPLLTEYRAVLLRPRISDRHGLSEHQVDTILQELAAHAAIREPEAQGEVGPDPADAHLWALRREHPGAVLVSGDRALQTAPAPGASVLSPASFVSQLGHLLLG